MDKAPPPLSKLYIRPIEVKDFGFVRSLAAQLPQFTVPSTYILWFFTHFHPDYCRVLEEDSGELKAYLLAMPTSKPRSGIAIWQVAAVRPIHGLALEHFSAYLRDLVTHTEVRTIFFTTSERNASLRLIRSLARQFAGCKLERLKPVPAGQEEYEFQLSIKMSQSSKSANAPADDG